MGKRRLRTLLHPNKTFLEGCSRITSLSAITETKVDPKERMSQIVATSGGSQENILNGVIQLKQDQFLANLTSLRSDLMQISNSWRKTQCLYRLSIMRLV